MAKKIKILRIVNRFNLGGPVYNALFLSRFMSDDFETLLIGGTPDIGETDTEHLFNEYGIKPIIIPELRREIRFKHDKKAYQKIKRIIEEYQPDIVHTHASKAGFLGRYAALKCNVPIILHTFHGHVFHSYFGKAKTELFKNIERYLAQKTSGIIAISPAQKEELVDVYKIAKEEKVHLIPLGFDLQKFTENKAEQRAFTREKYKLKEEEVAVAIIGRLAPVKNHAYFLNVAEKLLQTSKTPIRFFIVGDGTERKNIEEEIKRIHQTFPNRIVMTSWIKNMPTFLHGMDVVALTSKNEGTPVSIIESLAAGIPVISTDVGGVRDIIQDGLSGYVIKIENSETYINKLRLLIEQADKRKAFSVYGQDKVLNFFGYERLVSDMQNLYHSLLVK